MKWHVSVRYLHWPKQTKKEIDGMNRVLKSRILKRACVLLAVFVAAVLAYLFLARDMVKQEKAVYTSLEESVLPVAYVQIAGRRMNPMPPYKKEMTQDVFRDSIAVLPEDRFLQIYLEGGQGAVSAISYEIRSMDQKRLVERTELENWSTENGSVTADLPIQNLLAKDQHYSLRLTVEGETLGTVYYYTRIIWTDQTYAAQMIELASDFSQKTFDYDQAGELRTYLETDGSQDNSSLGNVNIKSSFSQLTWAGLEMTPLGDMEITLKELDGIMGLVQLRYIVSRANDKGGTEYYEVTDNFTMKWGEQRIYLMNYTRETNQVFTGNQSFFNGRRLMLGIADPSRLAVKKSRNSQFAAFVSNRDLWCYDQDEEKAILLFSFRSDKSRTSYNPLDQHGIKILSVDDEGNVDFMVYGYMNRGNHEGDNGIAVYHFAQADHVVEESFFIPLQEHYEVLKDGLDQLSYLSESSQLYFLLKNTIYSVDLAGHEAMVIASGLNKSRYAVSQNGSRIAWQDHDAHQEGKMIHLMNLDTGAKQDINANADETVRVLGFVANDFVYGRNRNGDQWMMNGRLLDNPFYSMEIVNYEMQPIAHYETPDQYLSDIKIEDSRIHYKQVIKTGDRSFVLSGEDTIVCNQQAEEDPLEEIGWYLDQELEKLYFIQLNQEVKTGTRIALSSPKSFTFNQSERLDLKSHLESEPLQYHAYGNGRYLGGGDSFLDVMLLAFDSMGFVVDRDQRVIWNRVDRANRIEISHPQMRAQKLTDCLGSFQEDQQSDDGYTILNARGCTLNQVLYFVGQGIPVAAFNQDGGYFLICGYDNFNVSLCFPESGETIKMGLNDAGNHFNSAFNDFICMVFTE